MPIILTVSVVLIAYVYVGYPLALWLVEALRDRREQPQLPYEPTTVPRISVLVAAHNEEANIAAIFWRSITRESAWN